MRWGNCAAAVLLLGWAASASYGQDSSRLIGSFGPQGVVNKPVDLTNLAAPTSPLPTQRSTFNLRDWFKSIRLPSFPPIFGQSNWPAPSTFPSYPDFKPIPFKNVAPYEPKYVPTNNRYRRGR